MLETKLPGLLFLASILLSPIALSQVAQPANQAGSQSGSQAAAPAPSQATVAADTQVTAVLESTVDARKAKPGDEVTARVTKDVKQDGQVVIRKGDRLLGRVASAKASGGASSESSLAVAFDRLKSAQATSQLQTVVTAVLSAPGGGGEEPPEMGPGDGPIMSSPPPRSSGPASGGGGLLGGVGSTVGSTLGAAGSVAGGAGGALGATTESTLGSTAEVVTSTPARAIRVETQISGSQASAMNSTFSTSQGNLRLESGTMLEFRVVGQPEKPEK